MYARVRARVWSYQREKVILQAQAIDREQRKISDSGQQTLQHSRAVLDPVEAYRAWIQLQREERTRFTDVLISGRPNNANSKAKHFHKLLTMQMITPSAHIQGERDLTLTHLSGPRLGMVTVSSGWSSRTFILQQLGSSLVQMLTGTIQLGQSSPSAHTHTQYTQTMRTESKHPCLRSGDGFSFLSFNTELLLCLQQSAFTVPVKICTPALEFHYDGKNRLRKVTDFT